MKRGKLHMPNLSYIAAFAMGSIMFAVFWKMLFGSASNLVALVGMIGVATVTVLFWLRNENQHPGNERQ